MVYVQLDKSTREGKKYMAIFYDEKRIKIKTVHFGAQNYQDYTTHNDDERKENYLSRHGKENWGDYMNPGSLSRYILWNYKSKSKSFNDYLQRFNLKKY
jgi:hypothetical protein